MAGARMPPDSEQPVLAAPPPTMPWVGPFQSTARASRREQDTSAHTAVVHEAQIAQIDRSP
ncbi:unnamed protein product [Cutaneotrichosporon oleaginosum]